MMQSLLVYMYVLADNGHIVFIYVSRIVIWHFVEYCLMQYDYFVFLFHAHSDSMVHSRVEGL